MGFTPLEGVPMATRSGSVDPGALLRPGLFGLGGFEDPRDIEGTLALAVYTYRVATAVGAMAAALNGLDALVFTAGVGEGSARVRADVCTRLAFLGVELDPDANAAARPDADVGAGSVRIVVLRAREDLVVARAVRELLD